MGNPQHLEWLLEGVESWNARRKTSVFLPDFRMVNIRREFESRGKLDDRGMIPLAGVDFEGANFDRAILASADLSNANLSHTILRGADLGGSILEGSELVGSDLRRTQIRRARFEKGTKQNSPSTGEKDVENKNTPQIDGPDLAQTKNIKTKNLNEEVKLVEPSNAPENGVEPSDLSNPSHLDASEELTGDTFSIEDGNLVVSKNPPPARNDLESLYHDLRYELASVNQGGTLHNLARPLAQALERLSTIVSAEWTELETVRFGNAARNLEARLSTSRAELIREAPSHVGEVEAILNTASHIASRLPDWIAFLDEATSSALQIEKDRAKFRELINSAMLDSHNTPHIDQRVPELLEEYIGDNSLESDIAAQHAILNILHEVWKKTIQVSKDLKDEVYKQGVKAVALATIGAFTVAATYFSTLTPATAHWVPGAIKFIRATFGF